MVFPNCQTYSQNRTTNPEMRVLTIHCREDIYVKYWEFTHKPFLNDWQLLQSRLWETHEKYSFIILYFNLTYGINSKSLSVLFLWNIEDLLAWTSWGMLAIKWASCSSRQYFISIKEHLHYNNIIEFDSLITWPSSFSITQLRTTLKVFFSL